MREPHYLRDIFSRQAAKVAKTCIPCAAFAFFAPLREDKQHARASFLARYFFSPSRQGRKDLYTLRSLCVLRAFAREKTACESLVPREIFFLAKPPRSLRPVYPAQPWRSLRLCERKNHASDIISLRESFLAKPQRSQRLISSPLTNRQRKRRRLMNGRRSVVFHDSVRPQMG